MEVKISNASDKKVNVDLAMIESGRRILLVDDKHAPVIGVITHVSLIGADVVFAPTPLDGETIRELGLEPDKMRVGKVLISGSILHVDLALYLEPAPFLATAPIPPAPPPNVFVTIGDVGPIQVRLKRKQKIPLGDEKNALGHLADVLRNSLHTADSSPEFTHAHVAAVDNRLIVIPGIVGADIVFTATQTDGTTATALSLKPGQAKIQECHASTPVSSSLVLTSSAPEISLTIGMIGPRLVKFSPPSANGNTLEEVAGVLQAAINESDPAPAFSQACVLASDDSFYLLIGVVGMAFQVYLVFEFRMESQFALDSLSTVLLGNVALATHGETITDKVIGSGDGSQGFQQFALQKKPVTFTPYAGPGGAKNSLQVLVDHIRWDETPTLYGKEPDDQVYITRLEEDGTLLLKFGDGNTGVRLPTGRNNIVARYRQGIGLAGRVKKNTLTTLLDRPVGAKSVTNPLPASGGADRESLEDARVNAPMTVKTFDRAVSLRDFEDLVKNTGEVAKASATWVWDGWSRAVHLTVAGQKAGLFDSPNLARIHASLTTQRDPNIRLLIDNFVPVRITITATLFIDDSHIAQEVAKDAREALLKHLSFEALEFGETIYLSDIYRVLQDIDGVKSLDIDLFHFKDESPDYLAERGANTASVQQYLRIFPARPMPNDSSHVRPAEQAWIEVPSEDIILQPEGGISD